MSSNNTTGLIPVTSGKLPFPTVSPSAAKMCSGRRGVGFWSLCRKQSCFLSTPSERIFREGCGCSAGVEPSQPLTRSHPTHRGQGGQTPHQVEAVGGRQRTSTEQQNLTEADKGGCLRPAPPPRISWVLFVSSTPLLKKTIDITALKLTWGEESLEFCHTPSVCSWIYNHISYGYHSLLVLPAGMFIMTTSWNQGKKSPFNNTQKPASPGKELRGPTVCPVCLPMGSVFSSQYPTVDSGQVSVFWGHLLPSVYTFQTLQWTLLIGTRKSMIFFLLGTKSCIIIAVIVLEPPCLDFCCRPREIDPGSVILLLLLLFSC